MSTNATATTTNVSGTTTDASGTTVQSTVYPTTGSSFGALKYNINEMLGWALGNPTSQDIFLYSNLAGCTNPSGDGYYIFNQSPSEPLFLLYGTYATDPTLAGLVSQYMVSTGWLEINTFTATDYATEFAKLDGLFGFSWLPWNVYGLPSADVSGSYCVRRYFSETDYTLYIQANPLCKGVMYIKMFTILKLLGISLGTYALIKLAIKLAEHEGK